MVTGPSGSGKSTLVNDILFPALQNRAARPGLNYRKLENVAGTVPGNVPVSIGSQINKVIRVDQSPLGSNPSSTPATYTGVFELIRQLYAQLPMSRARDSQRDSFRLMSPVVDVKSAKASPIAHRNALLARCMVRVRQLSWPRFTEDTLSIKYHEYSIHDILEMQVGKALEVLGNIPKIRRILQTLADVGLDYIALTIGSTLSAVKRSA